MTTSKEWQGGDDFANLEGAVLIDATIFSFTFKCQDGVIREIGPRMSDSKETTYLDYLEEE